MPEECDFCGTEFESEKKLHLHWGEEHEDELTSHQEEKVKKAERKQEAHERQRKRDLRKTAGYTAAAGLLLALAFLVGSELTSSSARSFDLENQPVIGDENASVTVVEFGDYRCPYCATFSESIYPRIKENYIDTGQVRFSFINYAFLDRQFPGRSSQRAAVAAECVYEQDEDEFWKFHKAVYANQGPESQDWATEEFLLDLAGNSTDVDTGELETCIQDSQTASEVNRDLEVGRSSGVDSTPSVYVNGEAVNWRYSSVSEAIDSHLE